LLSKNARSITAGSRSNCAGRPSNPKASLELDALSTAARALRVRVVELEPVTHHAAHEVEGHAAEGYEALRIDADRDTVVGELLVRRLELVSPLEDVREARAAAAAHAHTNARVGRTALVALTRDFLRGCFGDRDLLLADDRGRLLGVVALRCCHHDYLELFF